MDLTSELSVLVGLLIALSVASERIVEIIKGLVPFLNQKSEDSKKENRRKVYLQVLAIAAGIATAFLALPALPDQESLMLPAKGEGIAWYALGLGILASGGSGFWNSIQEYLLAVKKIKKQAAAGG